MAVIGTPNATLGVQALEAIGLPTDKCTGLEIRFQPNNILVATATYAPDAEQMEKLIRVIESARSE